MSYTAICKDWTQIIAVGGTIEAVDTNEFQTNIDWISDNLACLSHNSTYYSTHYSGDDAGYNSTYRGTHYTTYQATNDSAEQAVHNSLYKTTNYTGNLSSHYDQNYAGHDVGYDATYNITHQTGVDSADDASHNSGAQVGANSVAYTGDYAYENITFNYPVNVGYYFPD